MLRRLLLTVGIGLSCVASGCAATPNAAESADVAAKKTTLAKLRAQTELRVREGAVRAFYSPDADEKEVAFTQDLVGGAVKFFERAPEVSTKIETYVAILNKKHWETLPIEEEIAPGQRIAVPYGLPGLVDRGPFGAVLGTSRASDVDGDGSDDNVLIAGNLDVVRKLDAERQKAILGAGYKTVEDAARRMPLLVAIHEMGHVYARKLGIAFEQHHSHMVDEMLATLFLYAFLNSDQAMSHHVRLWDEILDGYVTTQCPTHRSIKAFDEMYIGVADPSTGGSMLNFLYYQGMAHAMAKKIFSTGGLSFLSKIKEVVARLGPTFTVDDFYARLASADPRFADWYASFDRTPGCH